MKLPKFTYAKIKYSASKSIFGRAVKLFESGKVGSINESGPYYSAMVQGTKPYSVSVSTNRIDDADCTCYMGQNDRLCKHVLALALAVLSQAGMLNDTKKTEKITDLKEIKKHVNEGMKRIKPYRGPSKIWFRYQRDLLTGCGIIEEAVANLSSTKENAKYLWNVIKRLDRKLYNGVDDSDGTVGGCAYHLVDLLAGYTINNPKLFLQTNSFCSQTTHFDFNLSLENLIDKRRG